MAIEQNKKYTLTGAQIEDLARRVNDAQENASNALEGLNTKVDKETGKGLSTNDFTNSDKTKLDSVEANAQENIIESVSVNGTEITPDSNKNVDINVPAVENSLTSDSTLDALSAAQGKTLKEMIDSAGGIKTLTTEDYNWPANNPNRVAAWLLPYGFYEIPSDVNVGITSDRSAHYNSIIFVNRAGQAEVLAIPDNSSQYFLYSVGSSGSGRIISGFEVIDNLTSNSYTFPLSSRQGKVLNEKIGDLTTLTTTAKESIVSAINELDLELDNTKPLSGNTSPTTSTEGEIGQLYVDTSTGDIYYLESIDTSTDPDTYNWTKFDSGSSVNVVQTTGISTTDVMSQNAICSRLYRLNDSGTAYTTNIKIGSSSTQVTDTYGVSIGAGAVAGGTNTVAVGAGPNGLHTRAQEVAATAIGSGANAQGGGSVAIGFRNSATQSGAIAIGEYAQATQSGAIAIGINSFATQSGEMNIGSTQTGYGYNNSNYRLISGVYDPQSDHDAATKGYVDSNIPDAPSSQDFNALFN